MLFCGLLTVSMACPLAGGCSCIGIVLVVVLLSEERLRLLGIEIDADLMRWLLRTEIGKQQFLLEPDGSLHFRRLGPDSESGSC